jgi:toxin HigB-1
MIEIKDQGIKDIYDSINSEAARKTLPARLWEAAFAALDALHSAQNLGQMMALPKLRVHPLKGDLRGWYSATISGRARILFHYDKSTDVARDLWISKDHYGD